MFYREGLLAPRPTPKLEDHPLSAVHDCLFNLFAATLHIGCHILWAGHVARMGDERERIGSWSGNRRESDHWGDLGVDGWVILFGSLGGGMWVCGLDWTGPG